MTDYLPVDCGLHSEYELAGLTEDFSGAEIEQAIVAATYLAREQGATLNTDHIRTEIGQTRPLSQVMAEKVDYATGPRIVPCSPIKAGIRQLMHRLHEPTGCG